MYMGLQYCTMYRPSHPYHWHWALRLDYTLKGHSKNLFVDLAGVWRSNSILPFLGVLSGIQKQPHQRRSNVSGLPSSFGQSPKITARGMHPKYLGKEKERISIPHHPGQFQFLGLIFAPLSSPTGCFTTGSSISHFHCHTDNTF